MPWRPPQRLLGFLAPGTVIPANDTNGVLVAVAGSGRIRVIVLTSAAGTLRLRWRLADHKTNVTVVAANPTDTAILAATELVVDVLINPGHAYLEVAIVNGGAPSTVSYCDTFQTPYSN
jgi:hypothetical protein